MHAYMYVQVYMLALKDSIYIPQNPPNADGATNTHPFNAEKQAAKTLKTLRTANVKRLNTIQSGREVVEIVGGRV